MTFRSAWNTVLLWAIAILVVTSIPGSALPTAPGWEHTDKLVHGGLYAVLAFLAARALAVDRWGLGRKSGAALLVGVLVFAAVDEWHQRVIPGRSASLADWGADAVGAVAGLTTFLMARARREMTES